MQKNWDEATSALLAHALPVVRVTESEEGNVTVIWRQEPTNDEKGKASALIGAATHAW